MKKSLIFAAVAAVALASCAKQEQVQAPEQQLRTIHFSAEWPETKTIFGDPVDGKYPVLWSENDTQVALTMNYGNITPVEVQRSEDGRKIVFSAQLPAVAPSQFIVVNPVAAYKSKNVDEKRVMFELPAGQSSVPAYADEKAQIVCAVTETFQEVPEDVTLSFKHVPGYLHLNVQNVNLDGATVNAVSVKAEKPLAGRFFYYVESGEYENGDSMFNTVTVETESLESVWVAVAPADLSETTLEVTVLTDKGTFTKALALPAEREVLSGKIYDIAVDMEGVEIVEPVVYNKVTDMAQLHLGDRIIIAARDFDYAISTGQNDNNRSAAVISREGDKIVDPSDAVEIFLVEEGIQEGSYALRDFTDTDIKYLCAVNETNKSNQMTSEAKLYERTSWNITRVEEDESAYTKITALGVATRYWIRYNANNGNPIFSCYSDGSSTDRMIDIYRLDAEPVSVMNVVAPADFGTVPAGVDGASYTITVTGNSAWTASITGGATLSAASGTGRGTIEVTIPANEDPEEKTYVLTISTESGASPAKFEYTLTQQKNVVITVKPGDVVFYEMWDGGTAGQTPSQYLASGKATTTVLGNAAITYTQNGSGTKLYTEGIVDGWNDYIKTGGDLPAPEHLGNLMVQKGGGWWKISDIPCKGVSKLVLTYRNNRKDTKLIASSDTDGVTFGTISKQEYTSVWGKAYHVTTYEITITDESLVKFDVTITNTDSDNNNRVTDIKIVAPEEGGEGGQTEASATIEDLTVGEFSWWD